MDSYYTDAVLADRLISYIPDELTINTVVDFCVGGGELLNAVSRRYPDVLCTGIDLDANAIERLKTMRPNWNIIHSDFMDNKSIESSIGSTKFDLIVLNPPFSCRGSKRVDTQLDGMTFKVSTSMSFLIEALKYVSPYGIITAILPISVIYSQKDQQAWNYLQNKYNAVILEEQEHYQFGKCSPGIVLVSLNYKKSHILTSNTPTKLGVTYHVKLKRGQLSMCDIENTNNGLYQLIHTTNLCNNKIYDSNIKVNSHSIISGPAVIIPRVCHPNIGKIAIVKEGEIYAISDCILAMLVESNEDANTLFQQLINDWPNFKHLYKGTGAKYVTLERLSNYLGQ